MFIRRSTQILPATCFPWYAALVSEEVKETLRLNTPEPWKIRFGPNSVLKQRY